MPDPDLEIRGGHPNPYGGEGGLKKNRFFGPQFVLKIRGGPGPFPGSATVMIENNSGPICFQRNDQCFWVTLPWILISLEILGTIPGVFPVMAYTGRLRPKGVLFLRPQVCERVGILLVDV